MQVNTGRTKTYYLCIFLSFSVRHTCICLYKIGQKNLYEHISIADACMLHCQLFLHISGCISVVAIQPNWVYI